MYTVNENYVLIWDLGISIQMLELAVYAIETSDKG